MKIEFHIIWTNSWFHKKVISSWSELPSEIEINKILQEHRDYNKLVDPQRYDLVVSIKSIITNP